MPVGCPVGGAGSSLSVVLGQKSGPGTSLPVGPLTTVVFPAKGLFLIRTPLLPFIVGELHIVASSLEGSLAKIY